MKKYVNQEQIRANTKVYTNQDQAFRALLGGIGTGNISLDASGRLCDFEIHNHEDKKLKIPYTFFALWSRLEGEKPQALILEAMPQGISDKALGHPSGELIGLPRFDACREETNYPFYHYQFEKRDLPLGVSMTAYTPFIPLNSKDSGIPCFQIIYRVKNNTEKPAWVSVCGTMYNDIGFLAYDGFDKLEQKGEPFNKKVQWGDAKGILFGNRMNPLDVVYGTMALACENSCVTRKTQWLFGEWWDGAEEFWQDFRADGELNENVFNDSVGSRIGVTDRPSITVTN